MTYLKFEYLLILQEILLSPVAKAPTPTEKSKKQRDNIKMLQKLRLYNYCDRLRTVSSE